MDGILIVDKPKGMTSHDVVDFVRRRFHLKKVGHGGTLDPIATGVLVMLIGKATKSASTFLGDDKEYVATMTLGAISDTGDASGVLKPGGTWADLSEDRIRGVFDSFAGETLQTPPMYSAVKVNGRKLYQLARKGITIEVAPRKIFIRNIDILKIALPGIEFRVTCSKGTYVRQLCADIGGKLGCGAYLTALRRTRSGRFGIGCAMAVEDLEGLDIDGLSKRLTKDEDITRIK